MALQGGVCRALPSSISTGRHGGVSKRLVGPELYCDPTRCCDNRRTLGRLMAGGVLLVLLAAAMAAAQEPTGPLAPARDLNLIYVKVCGCGRPC